jgi:brefeldin A-resistance guanine nucleotide exchange factor 1
LLTWPHSRDLRPLQTSPNERAIPSAHLPSTSNFPLNMSSDGSDSSLSESIQDAITLAEPRRIPVAVNPVALVVTECITVTSAMRKHARWAHSSVAAILGGSSNKTPAIQKRDRAGQGIVGGTGQQEEAVPSRWGLRGKKGKSLQDNPLMSAFARLRNELKGCKGMCLDSMARESKLIPCQMSRRSTPPRCFTHSSRSSVPRRPLHQSPASR